jgi:hypothetical protein
VVRPFPARQAGARATFVALAVLASSLPAFAQNARNPAVAEALFEEAQTLVKAGNYDQACPKFKQSYDADPAGGTLVNLADCYERQMRTALAWSTYREARLVAQREGRDDRVAFCDERLKALEGRLSRLTVTVSPERSTGQTVTLDGVPLGEAAWGVALPVDPGTHELRSEIPGKEPFTITFDISGPGVTQEVTIPALTDAPSNKPGATDPGDEQARGRGSNTMGWILVGTGAVALGAGTFFGLRAMSRWDERNTLCEGGCNQEAKDRGDEAQTSATVSTIGFGVGLAAIGVGTYLLLSSGGEAPAKSARKRGWQVSPEVGSSAAGLSVRGGF